MHDIQTIIVLSAIALILTSDTHGRAAIKPYVAPRLTSDSAQPSAEDTSSWRGIINGWVKDQKIRRDALIATGMLLITATVIIWIVFHISGSALASVLPATIGKIIAGSTRNLLAATAPTRQESSQFVQARTGDL